MRSVHAIVAFILIGFGAGIAEGEEIYRDSHVSIALPDTILTVPCEASLAERAGEACVRVGADGRDGVLFVTSHAGYRLGSEAALTAHMSSSESALSDIPNIHVMQSRMIGTSPLVGMMEVIRRDTGISSVIDIAPPLRQTSILYPSGERLIQVFLYMPLERGDVALYEQLVKALSSGEVLIAPEVERSLAQETPRGVMSLMPKALFYGGAAALAVILFGVWRARVTRQRRRREEEAEARRVLEGAVPDFELEEGGGAAPEGGSERGKAETHLS